jgi:transcription antitermination factor NusB
MIDNHSDSYNDAFDYFVPEEYIEAKNLSLSYRRGLILHLLYVLEMHDYELPLETLRYYYHIDFHIIIEHDDPALVTVQKIIDLKNELDEKIKKYLHSWDIERLSIIVKLILRYSFFELLHTTQDAKLIINEGVELAKSYAESESYKFVNGILDNYCKKNNRK